jgi:hypothetical protein
MGVTRNLPEAKTDLSNRTASGFFKLRLIGSNTDGLGVYPTKEVVRLFTFTDRTLFKSGALGTNTWCKKCIEKVGEVPPGL